MATTLAPDALWGESKSYHKIPRALDWYQTQQQISEVQINSQICFQRPRWTDWRLNRFPKTHRPKIKNSGIFLTEKRHRWTHRSEYDNRHTRELRDKVLAWGGDKLTRSLKMAPMIFNKWKIVKLQFYFTTWTLHPRLWHSIFGLHHWRHTLTKWMDTKIIHTNQETNQCASRDIFHR